MVQKRAESAQSYTGQWLWWTGQTQLPAYLRSAYEEWHTMPHRSSSVLVPATVLASFVALRQDLAPFVDAAGEWLGAHLKEGGRYAGWAEAERIAIMLDRSNYHPATGPDGGDGIEFRAPADWWERQQEDRLAEAREEFVDQLPALAASAYGHQGSQEADIDGYLDAIAPDTSASVWKDRPEIAVARAALCLHPTMGSRSPERLAWARQVVLDASESPDPTPGLDSFVGNMLRAPVVLPRAAIALLVRDASNEAARRAVARHLRVSPPHDLAGLADTARLFADDLGDDLVRVVRALMERAEASRRLSDAEQDRRLVGINPNGGDAEGLQSNASTARRDLQRIEDAFVDTSLSPTLPDLDVLAPLRPPRPSNDARRRPQRYRPISGSILALSLTAYPADTLVGSVWYDALSRYADQTFSPLASPAGQEHTGIDALPDNWQGALLKHLGAASIAVRDPDAAEALWRPVLNLGAAPRGWVDPFAFEVTRLVVVPNPDPASLETWRRMVRYALGHPAWVPGHAGSITAHEGGQTWRSLLGLSSVADVRGWTSEIRPVFDAIRDELLEWSAGHLGDSESVGWFAGVLVQDAFEAFVVLGLSRIALAAEAAPAAFWGREQSSVEPHVTALLLHVWSRRRSELRADQALARAFRALLQTLVANQHPAALHLADEVRTAGL